LTQKNLTFEDFYQGQKRGTWSTVALSLILHIGILCFYFPRLTKEKSALTENDLIEITDYKEFPTARPEKAPKRIEINPSNPKAQIAESEDAQNRKVDPKASYLGKHNQSVEKEMRASQIDDFRSKQGTGAKGIPTQVEMIPPTAEETGKPTEFSEEGGLLNKSPETKTGVKRNWKTLSLKDLSIGGDGGATGASDDKLNVDRGERTLLSTREYKFFGYYQRIKDLLRQYWKPNIEHQMARLWGKGKQVKEDELTTRVLVLLDEAGKISKISKIAGSGYIELDDAAIQAFQAAAPFPNPPKAMLDEDGFVRVNWDFILTTDNSPRIQFRNVGSVPPTY
jgi:protein TonB